MGNKKAFFAVTTTALAAAGTFVACGSDKAAPDAAVVIHDSPVDTKVIDAPPDAPGFDFSCAGNTAPTPSANLTVSSIVNEVGFSGSITFAGLGNANVDLCTGDCTGSGHLGSGTTDGSGNVAIGPVSTGGTAIDGYVRVAHAGDRTILGFPASPFAADTIDPIITFQNVIIDNLGSFGCDQGSGNGMVGLLVTDCMDKPITDSAQLTISVKQGGSNVGDAPIDAGALSSMAAGFFLICNVPPGATTTVGGSYSGMNLRAHDVVITAGTTTEAIVRPGF